MPASSENPPPAAAPLALPSSPCSPACTVCNCIEQAVNGNRSIIGLMLESNLEAGNQEIPADRSKLRYGVSVTDGCIDWPTTDKSLQELAVLLKPLVQARKSA